MIINIFAYYKLKQTYAGLQNLPKKSTRYQIVFKFDDLKNCSRRVMRLDQFVKTNQLKVCWGIIGKSLKTNNFNLVNFIKENNQKNYCFFNHGYLHLGGPEYEFMGKTIEQQANYIRQTQQLIWEKTNIRLDAFGAPCNHIDNATTKALSLFKEIKYWFYGREDFHGIVLKRKLEMEEGVGNPNFEFFKRNWEKLDKSTETFFTLQGHPDMWNKLKFLHFQCIAEYLKREGCEFVFPQELHGGPHD